MKIKILAMAAMVSTIISCTDEALDPLQFDKIQKGSYLALRGAPFERLNNTGCANEFDRLAPAGNFEIEADFLSEEPESLDELRVYVVWRDRDGLDSLTRELGTVSGDIFAVPDGGRYRRGSFSYTTAAVLTALGNPDPLDIDLVDLEVRIDLSLKDGRTVSANSIVNGGIFESAQFYPAHRVLFCAL
jgi:hypothetical protein